MRDDSSERDGLLLGVEDVQTDVITSDDIGGSAAARIVDQRPVRQWRLAIALLTVIALEAILLIVAVMLKRLVAQDAVALAGILITPLVTLLGAAFAFYYRDEELR